jgi:hypothetical protein
MNVGQVLASDQFRDEEKINVVKQKLKSMKIKPLTDIQIHHYYPEGWTATFGAGNHHAYILTYIGGRFTGLSIEPLIGFFPGGGFIRPASKSEALLVSLERNDDESVITYANSLFIRRDDTIDLDAIKAFENYANCTVYNLEIDDAGWLVGEILYRGEYFGWGWIEAENF